MNARERANILVSRFRKGSLPYDMEQWACYAIMNAEKQARVEVLAACTADVEKALSIYMEHKGRSKDDKALIGGVCLGIKNRLEQLQPAAKDLEELLEEVRREAELEGLRFAREFMKEGLDCFSPSSMVDRRIAELEKAHEAALPHAAGQLLKALTEGGKFAVDSPLARVKERVEAMLREERENYSNVPSLREVRRITKKLPKSLADTETRYTQDQLDEYIKQEREKCARIAESCDISEETILAYNNRQDIAMRVAIAEAIRELEKARAEGKG